MDDMSEPMHNDLMQIEQRQDPKDGAGTFLFPLQKKIFTQIFKLLIFWAVMLGLTGLLLVVLPIDYGGWLFVCFMGGNLIFILCFYHLIKRVKFIINGFGHLLHHTNDLLWTLDSNLLITGLGGAVASVSGFSAKDLLGTPLISLFSLEKAGEFTALIRQNRPFLLEAGIQKPNGRFLAVEISGSPILEKGTDLYQGVVRDISEQKSQEKKLSQFRTDLHRAEKLKNLGLLAGSVSHDLNNILSGIATYPEVLLMDEGLDPKVRQGLIMIKDSGRKASSVVSDLLTISKGDRAEKQILNINTVIERYMGAAEFNKIQETYSQVEIEVTAEPELLNIRGSYIHIEKVIMNLVLNAVEETPAHSKAKVFLTTANFYVGDAGDKDLLPGEYVMLRVEDNGHGIPEAFQDKLFDPFFPQKEMGKSGTGLGLTVVWNTVKDHDGAVHVTSNDQGTRRGTRFDLFFPATREELPRAEKNDSFEEIQGRGQRLMIVDDLASQRKIAGIILKNLGYTVFSAANGLDAVDFVRDNPVDLLILDMVMEPGISGLETFEKILEIYPDQKAIIASGHSESEDVLKTQKLGAGSFVKKPYTIMDMGIAVKEELEK